MVGNFSTVENLWLFAYFIAQWIEVRINETVENGQNLTSVYLKANGDIQKKTSLKNWIDF